MPDYDTRFGALTGNHPISRGEYTLATPMIEHLLNSVVQWIDNRIPGAIVYGDPRRGKTKAIAYLMANLSKVLGQPIPSCKVDVKNMDKMSQKDFFGVLGVAMGHPVALAGRGMNPFYRVVERIVEPVLESESNRYLMVLDDAQKLQDRHLDYLMDLYNECLTRSVWLLTVLVGQPELKTKRGLLKEEGKLQIVERLMSRRMQFYGARSVEELAQVFEGYDVLSEYPTNSGISYTRFFLPEAYRNGFRLSHHAGDIWQCLSDVRNDAGRPDLVELPMHYVAALAEQILRSGLDFDAESFALSEAAIRSAIDYTGYVESVVVGSLDESDVAA